MNNKGTSRAEWFILAAIITIAVALLFSKCAHAETRLGPNGTLYNWGDSTITDSNGRMYLNSPGAIYNPDGSISYKSGDMYIGGRFNGAIEDDSAIHLKGGGTIYKLNGDEDEND